jgi:hypothetical protein
MIAEEHIDEAVPWAFMAASATTSGRSQKLATQKYEKTIYRDGRVRCMEGLALTSSSQSDSAA